MCPASLDFVEHRLFKLGGKGHYDWVDIKHFALSPPDATAEALLRALIAHPRFRDSYAEPESQNDAVDIHGPYRLECVDLAAYDSVGRDEAWDKLASFVCRYGTAEKNEARLATMKAGVSNVLQAADELHVLRALGEAAQHVWGWVLDDFTELVAIDRSAARVSLLVAAAD